MSIVLLSILSLMACSLYEFAAKSTLSRVNQIKTFEEARVALDLITRDINCIYYKENVTPFWHWHPDHRPANWKQYRNELLAFVALSDIQPNKNCESELLEVKYQLYYATSINDKYNGWLRRSVTGDNTSKGDNSKWNIYSNFKVGYSTNTDSPESVFTADSKSSGYYQKVIPHVTNLSFICFDEEGFILQPDLNTAIDDNAGNVTELPFSVEVVLKTMDGNSWDKWLHMFGKGEYPLDEPIKAKLFRLEHERTFDKTIFIGNRGQYN